VNSQKWVVNNEKSNKAKTMNGNKMKGKIISKILSVKEAFHRLRQYIRWMRFGINYWPTHHVTGCRPSRSRPLFLPSCVPDGRSFVAKPVVAFGNSVGQPLTPLERLWIACLDAYAFSPSPGAWRKDECDAADQVIDHVEFDDMAKDHVTEHIGKSGSVGNLLFQIDFFCQKVRLENSSCHACTVSRSFRAYLFANSNGHLWIQIIHDKGFHF
jgi:hypothetical protein